MTTTSGERRLAFADVLRESCGFLFGSTIRVLTDRGDLARGRAWQQQLDTPIADTQVLEVARAGGLLDAAFSEVAASAPDVVLGDERAEPAQTILELRVALDVPQLLDAERLVGVLRRISRHLRPASRALAEAIRPIRTMQRSAEDWRAALS